MSLIEWIFVTELVLLATAGLFWLISLTMQEPDDPLVRFYLTFWKVLLRRRVGIIAAVNAMDVATAREYEQLKQSGNIEGIKDLLREQVDQQEFDDAEVGAVVAEAMRDRELARASGSASAENDDHGPAQAATLSVTIVPFSPKDELIVLKADGAVVNVTTAAEDGASNKAVIELLARALGVKVYQLSLVKGHYRAYKVVQIAGIDHSELEIRADAFS